MRDEKRGEKFGEKNGRRVKNGEKFGEKFFGTNGARTRKNPLLGEKVKKMLTSNTIHNLCVSIQVLGEFQKKNDVAYLRKFFTFSPNAPQNRIRTRKKRGEKLKFFSPNFTAPMKFFTTPMKFFTTPMKFFW